MSPVAAPMDHEASNTADVAPVLEFKEVGKAFRNHHRITDALRSVSLIAQTGCITGLIGPDGAGKTTTMRLATGLLLPDQGRVVVCGTDTTEHSDAVRSFIGYMPQRFGLYEDLTVQENLDLYSDLQDVPQDERRSVFDTLLAMGGLAPFTTRLAGRLSGGMKQKLGLICTLLRTPRLLVLDEPTVGVDPVSRRELWAIIKQVSAERGVSVLLSTAYLDEADHCDTIVILREGSVLASGTPKALTARVAGRTFKVHPRRVGDREAQEALSARPGVLDALLHGDHIRVVVDDQSVATTVSDIAGPLEPVDPRFEDAFIDLLLTKVADRHQHQPIPEPVAVSSAPTGAPEIIRVESATRDFDAFRAVDRVSFSVRRGEVFGLLGANGAGKTTMFRMLCGLLKPSAGRLEVDGVSLRTAAAKARARIGYMSQGFALYRELTVTGNLRFFAGAYGLRGRRLRERIAWALEEFELDAVSSMRSDRLSLGHKQRLAFACALMHEPSVLFLDEPTSGVDPLARREFWRRINTIARTGVTVLITTHFMEEAEYCDRVMIMVSGRVVALGSPAAIREQAALDPRTSPTMEDAFLALVGATSGAPA